MYSRILSVILGGAFCFLTLVSTGLAAENVVVIPVGSNLFKGDQYLTVSSAAFTPKNHETEYSKPVFFYDFYGYLKSNSALGGYMAPVNLPDGAIVSQFSTYLERGRGSCHMTFGKHSLNDHQYELISTVETMLVSVCP